MQLLEGYLRTGMQLSALLAAWLPTVCVVTGSWPGGGWLWGLSSRTVLSCLLARRRGGEHPRQENAS